MLWGFPIAFVLLISGVAVAQALRQFPIVQAFVMLPQGAGVDGRRQLSFSAVASGAAFLKSVLHALIIRAGIQILADHPRLYWKRDCTPGTDWFRFQKTMVPVAHPDRQGRFVMIPGWLGIPGIRHSIGVARWWHFSANLLRTFNGVAYYVLLFSTDQWRRLVPTTGAVFPNAASTALQYLSLTFPPDHSWTQYNSLQQLVYFTTVFIATPTSIVTGLMKSPAISNHPGWDGRALNRQRARSLHFLALWWLLLFILAHVTLVFITRPTRVSLNMMWAGVRVNSWSRFAVFVPVITLAALAWCRASPFTICHARLVQKTGEFMIGRLKGLAERWSPHSQLTEKGISPYFWPSGTMPASTEFESLVKAGAASYHLRIVGLVETPREFPLAELRAMPKQEQTTLISAFRAGRALPNGAACRCATSSTWCVQQLTHGTLFSTPSRTAETAAVITTCTR